MLRYLTNILILLAILVAISVTGCNNIAQEYGMGLKETEKESNREVLDSIINSNDRDQGLVWASEKAPVLELTAKDQGITFTVHQLIADSVRVILIASWEDEEGHSETTGGTNPSIKQASSQLFTSSSTWRVSRTDDGKASGIFLFYTSLDLEKETVMVEFEEIDGVRGDWSMEVPVFRTGNDHEIIRGLISESDGFEFYVYELILGSTATSINWGLQDTIADETEKRGYCLVKKRQWDIGEIWDSPFFSRIILEDTLVLMNNKEIIDSYEISGGGSSKSSISSTEYHLPVKEPSELKVILKNIVMQKTNPVKLDIKKSNDKWKEFAREIEGTMVKVENIDLNKGEIVLSYQSGRLIEMSSPILKDNQGTLYEFKEMSGEIPELDSKMEEIYDKQLEMEEAATIFHNLKRYQTLYFEALPENLDTLYLSFKEAIFVSDKEWVIEIPYY
ncbi:MAG: hypothetical protein APF76_14250 [Desulfitibacter sp. BRH_c19]|nr:MAG: hypothetical protein APF76_14250 [Desulfitibacter sp. BRH_c19]